MKTRGHFHALTRRYWIFRVLYSNIAPWTNMSQVSTTRFIRDVSTLRLSPLAPGDPNACPRFSLQMASARKAGQENAQYSHKCAYNPLFQKKVGEEQESRRRLFLNKVRQGSENTRWESRSEQVRHHAHLSSHS